MLVLASGTKGLSEVLLVDPLTCRGAVEALDDERVVLAEPFDGDLRRWQAGSRCDGHAQVFVVDEPREARHLRLEDVCRGRAADRPRPSTARAAGEDEFLLRAGDAESRPSVESADGPVGDVVEGEGDLGRGDFFVRWGLDRSRWRDELNGARAVKADFADEAHGGHSMQTELFGQIGSAVAFGQERIDPAQGRLAVGCRFVERELSAERDGSGSRPVRFDVSERRAVPGCVPGDGADVLAVEVDVERVGLFVAAVLFCHGHECRPSRRRWDGRRASIVRGGGGRGGQAWGRADLRSSAVCGFYQAG